MTGCNICGGQLGKKNRSGRCRSCTTRALNADPAHREKITAGVRLAFAANPARLEAARKSAQQARYSQAAIERRRAQTPEQMREMALRKCAAYPKGCEERQKAGARQSATKLAHIPREKRGDYRFLVNSKGLPAVEAARIVLDEFNREMAAFRAKLQQVSA